MPSIISADEFWDVVAYDAISGTPSTAVLTGDQATKTRQDALGNTISCSSRCRATSRMELPRRTLPTRLFRCFSYSYLPTKHAYAVTTRQAIGPIAAQSAPVTYDQDGDGIPETNINVPSAKVLDYSDTRVRREVFSTQGDALLTAVRTTNMQQPDGLPTGIVDVLHGGMVARRWTQFDDQGRLKIGFNADAAAVKYLYDDAQSGTGLLRLIVQPNGESESYVFDSAGHRLQATDATGETMNWVYDGLGRTSKQSSLVEYNDTNGARKSGILERVWGYSGPDRYPHTQIKDDAGDPSPKELKKIVTSINPADCSAPKQYGKTPSRSALRRMASIATGCRPRPVTIGRAAGLLARGSHRRSTLSTTNTADPVWLIRTITSWVMPSRTAVSQRPTTLVDSANKQSLKLIILRQQASLI